MRAACSFDGQDIGGHDIAQLRDVVGDRDGIEKQPVGRDQRGDGGKDRKQHEE
jgi:hypothetical protein